MNAPRRSRTALAAVVVVVALAAIGASAPAAQPLASCPGQTLEQPFLRWLDPAWYVSVPDGGLERGGAGWTLRAGAAVVRGNEPFFVRSGGDSRSLVLAAGASATTPWLCAGLEHPTLRLFASNSVSPLAALSVELLLERPLGGVETVPLGTITGVTRWQPTAPLLLLANATALPVAGDGSTRVAFRFRAGSLGGWALDDVYVDPFKGT